MAGCQYVREASGSLLARANELSIGVTFHTAASTTTGTPVAQRHGEQRERQRHIADAFDVRPDGGRDDVDDEQGEQVDPEEATQRLRSDDVARREQAEPAEDETGQELKRREREPPAVAEEAVQEEFACGAADQHRDLHAHVPEAAAGESDARDHDREQHEAERAGGEREDRADREPAAAALLQRPDREQRE